MARSRSRCQGAQTHGGICIEERGLEHEALAALRICITHYDVHASRSGKYKPSASAACTAASAGSGVAGCWDCHLTHKQPLLLALADQAEAFTSNQQLRLLPGRTTMLVESISATISIVPPCLDRCVLTYLLTMRCAAHLLTLASVTLAVLLTILLLCSRSSRSLTLDMLSARLVVDVRALRSIPAVICRRAALRSWMGGRCGRRHDTASLRGPSFH